MGDADGYIPQQIEAPFFYNEVNAKLQDSEKDFIKKLYGLKDYYTYHQSSDLDELRIKKLFTQLGVTTIPKNIHIMNLEKNILNQINNQGNRV